MISTDNPDLADVVEEIVAKFVGPRLGGLPGRVISYNRAKGLAVVRLSVKLARAREDGQLALIEAPPVAGCPVAYFSVGGSIVHADLAPGDDVWVAHADRDISAWIREGGDEPRDPQDRQRRMNIQDAVVFPGIVPTARALSTREGKLTLGSRDGTGARIEIGGGKIRIGSPTVDVLEVVDGIAGEVEGVTGTTQSILTATGTWIAAASVLPGMAAPSTTYAAAVTTLSGQLTAITAALAVLRTQIQSLKE